MSDGFPVPIIDCLPLPPDPGLPAPLPVRARSLVIDAIDKGLADVLKDIDNLIHELQELKVRITSDAECCKDVVGNHFNTQAGAIEHAEEIRRNMQHLAAGGKPDAG